MSKFKSKKDTSLPAVNTASLPDIVFMLLFFFMVVTVMREDELKVENRLPQADQIEKLDKKYPISYIYVGKPTKSLEDRYGTEARLQLNDKFADISEIQAFINAERGALLEALVPKLTVSLKVDREANMGIVSDIKKELRKASAFRINYTTAAGEATGNLD